MNENQYHPFERLNLMMVMMMVMMMKYQNQQNVIDFEIQLALEALIVPLFFYIHFYLQQHDMDIDLYKGSLRVPCNTDLAIEKALCRQSR